MTFKYQGTSVITQDDHTQAPWSATLCTVASAGICPETGLGAYSYTVDSDGNSRRVLHGNFAMADATYWLEFWVLAGSVDSVDAGVRIGTSTPAFRMTGGSVLRGPGTVTVASDRILVEGLSTSEWTLVRGIADGDTTLAANLFFYPNNAATQFADDSIIVSSVRIALASTDPGWRYLIPASHMLLNRRSRGM